MSQPYLFENGKQAGILQTDELTSDKTGVMNETATSVLEGKRLHEIIPSFSMVEVYNETPICIPV